MRRWLTSLVLATAACGGGGSAFDGLYSIDTWNENLTSCTDPGPSLIGVRTETVFYLEKEDFGFINAYACRERTECETKAADDTTHIGGFGAWEDGSDGDGWTHLAYFADEDIIDPTMCVGSVFTGSLTADGEAGVILRSEHLTTPLFPKVNGACVDEDALIAATGVPCGELEVVHGTKIGDI